MTSNTWFCIILSIVLVGFVIDFWLEYVNIKSRKQPVPKKLDGVFTPEKYAEMQKYHSEKDFVNSIQSTIMLCLTLFALFGGWLGAINNTVQSYTTNVWLQTVLFFVAISAITSLINIPFAYYDTFVIEEKYGFNKTTLKTFVLDMLKGILISAIIILPLSWVLIWVFGTFQNNFWWIAFTIVFLFSLIMAMFYTSILLPLFNKLSPLPQGDLRNAIEEYCTKNGFKLKHLFVMDGSKRSTKANAFFSGLGPKKTIVLYDTLVKGYSVNEVVAVLAHEVGHYKHKHVWQSMLLGGVVMLFTFYVLSIFLHENQLSVALGGQSFSLPLALVGFSMVFAPIGVLTGILSNVLSRKNEYQADAFAKKTYAAEPLITALKKMSADSFSNLTPHPVYVFFNYSHPTLLQRITRLEKETQ